MATFVQIQEADIREFLEDQGFKEMALPGTKELVFGRVVEKDTCLRVYTSVVGGQGRRNGKDAIRVVVAIRSGDEVKVVGADKRVHRVEGWRKNLQSRLDSWREQFGPACPKCGKPTVQRRSKRGLFWGCSDYPNCRSVQPVE